MAIFENTYIEQLGENGFTTFSILKTNPFLEKKTLNLVIGFYIHSKDQVFNTRHKSYLTFQSWLLLMGGLSNLYCAMTNNKNILFLANMLAINAMSGSTVNDCP